MIFKRISTDENSVTVRITCTDAEKVADLPSDRDLYTAWVTRSVPQTDLPGDGSGDE